MTFPQKLIKNMLMRKSCETQILSLGMVTLSFTDQKALELFIEDIPDGKIADYLFASANFRFCSAKIGISLFRWWNLQQLPIRHVN